MKFLIIAPTAGILVAISALMYFKTQAQSQPAVTIATGRGGLTSVKVAETEYLRDGEFKLSQVTLSKGSGESYPGSTAGTFVFDDAEKKAKGKYSWGTVSVGYASNGNRLDLDIEARNTSKTDTIQGLWFEPLTLRFPAKLTEYDGSIPLLTSAVGGPAVLRVTYPSGSLLVASSDTGKPVLLGFPWSSNRPDSTDFPLTLTTDKVRSFPDSYPAVHRTIPPGGSDHFRVSLRFGNPGASVAELGRDIYTEYATAFPLKLDWQDRRPIGSVFLASSDVTWPKNPRGWFGNSKIDVTTPAGKEDFRAKIFSLADNTLNILREMNAQGVITWDVEGQEFAHSVSYIGDPRLVKTLAPEMDAVADDYFAKLRNAGFKVGISVRPQQFRTAQGKPEQTPVDEPAKLLIEKIRYAKERWGISLVYIDSNVNAHDPNPIDAQQLAEVAAAFPDVLLIPEHSSFQYYAFSAPYKELRQGYTSTPEVVRLAYPKAFTVISTADGLLDHNREALVKSIKRGDSVIYRSWYPDPQNEHVKSLFGH